MPAPAGPSSLPPAPPPTLWDRLPDAMKLILIKELTSWYRYRETTLLLRLTSFQERAFRDLYAGELKKQERFDTAIRAKLEARDRDLFGNRPYTSLNRPAPSHARAEAEAQQPIVPPLELLTDYITVQNMKMGEDYLVAVGFDRDWVDLGHWIGHTGTARFEIEMDQMGHHRRACEAGSQGTSSLQRQPPVWPSRSVARQARVQDQTQAQAEAQARPEFRQPTYRRRNNRSTGSSRHTTGTSLQPPALAQPVEPVGPVEQPPTQKRGRGRPRIYNSRPTALKKANDVTGRQQKETAVHWQEPREHAKERSVPVPASSYNSDEDGEYELE